MLSQQHVTLSSVSETIRSRLDSECLSHLNSFSYLARPRGRGRSRCLPLACVAVCFKHSSSSSSSQALIASYLTHPSAHVTHPRLPAASAAAAGHQQLSFRESFKLKGERVGRGGREKAFAERFSLIRWLPDTAAAPLPRL